MTATARAKKKDVQISVGNTDVQISPDGKKVTLNGDFNKVVLNGVVITIPDGSAFKQSAPANDTTVAAAKAVVGQLTEEGVYIGRLKDKHGVERDYFAAPTDAQDENGKRLSLNFNDAAEYAKKSNALDHNDWVVPTGWGDQNGAPDVLQAMFNSKSKGAFKGTFDEADSSPTGYYWSSSLCSNAADYAKFERFSDGQPYNDTKTDTFSVRLVRSVAV